MAVLEAPTGIAGNTRFAIAMSAVLLWLVGCTAVPPVEQLPVEVPEPVVIEPPPPDPVVIEPQPEPRPAPLVQANIRKPQVAIVLSSRQPDYEGVATELDQYLDGYTVFDLGDKSMPPVSVFRKIEDSDTDAVVAVGLRAAVSAKSMATVPVLFCQVFNYKDHGLVTENSKGIAALPPLSLQIAAWKKLDPALKSIGAIVGEGHEDLIAEAEIAAAEHGVELHIRTVKSDRETLYVFNRLVASIDGFWLFPDNRVLSTPVLNEMLTYAARHRVQVAVFNDSLLDMGAAISSSTVQSDIAKTIAAAVDRIAAGEFEELPPVSGLSDVQIVTNEDVLQRLLQDPAEATVADGQ